MKKTMLNRGSKTLKSGSGFKQSKSTLKSGNRLPRKSKAVAISYKGVPLWSKDEADARFSGFIILRDGRCKRCGDVSGLLTCSHFHGRGNATTRFDPDNSDTLCLFCHNIWEMKKYIGGEYYLYKRQQLGIMAFIDLDNKSKETMPMVDAIKECMDLLGATARLPREDLKEIQF